MSKGKSGKIRYRPYGRGQVYLIPPGAGGLIPANRLVRLASEVIGGTGIERLLRKHRGGGGAE